MDKKHARLGQEIKRRQGGKKGKEVVEAQHRKRNNERRRIQGGKIPNGKKQREKVS